MRRQAPCQRAVYSPSIARTVPKQITVIAPLPALAAVRYQLRVIDTRGIDEPLADRPDLRSYLEDPRTIPVLCSEFLSALDPSVVQLLRGAVETGTWTPVAQRSVILLLPKNDEALQVQHDSGELPETFEEGYEIKADKVRGDLRKIASIGRNGLHGHAGPSPPRIRISGFRLAESADALDAFAGALR